MRQEKRPKNTEFSVFWLCCTIVRAENEHNSTKTSEKSGKNGPYSRCFDPGSILGQGKNAFFDKKRAECSVRVEIGSSLEPKLGDQTDQPPEKLGKFGVWLASSPPTKPKTSKFTARCVAGCKEPHPATQLQRQK